MDEETFEQANAVLETGGVYLLVGVLVGGFAVTTTALVDLLFVAPGSLDPWNVLPAILPHLDQWALLSLWIGVGTVGAVALERLTAVDLTGTHERREKVIRTAMGGIFVIGTTVILVILWLLGLFG